MDKVEILLTKTNILDIEPYLRTIAQWHELALRLNGMFKE
jgi:hypothetical protein